ncbi:Ferredoxin [Nostocoides japonicum T1-X7]|uniref:Ferredoxin n=1 Tax=Nostocoides japonicum T1-X7 TaxID=1194083 RepID=A0A077M1P6_9MICO|nr:hybrid-cluster NAD(P)-dependent oxidoreductase [Tetrasphaera japonica]CCH79766.1 Ferredoxin [Tetrasphaera japonica T1-X7]
MTLLPLVSAPDCWQDTDRATLVCRAVLEITHDVRSFHFAPEGEQTFGFEPGQFVTVEVEVEGQTYQRCYTISSPPTRPHLISITVKRVLGGPVSNWLHDNLLPGGRLTVQAPLGSFTLTDPVAPKYLFLSAGSGITPLMSMTRTLFDLGSDADVLFVHSARTPADIVFRRELEAIASVAPNIRVVHVCEGDYPSERWMGLRGRLSTAMLQAIAPDLEERETYICGPAAYMSSVRRILQDVAYDMRRYHEESFSFDSLPAGDVPAAPEAEVAAGSADALGASADQGLTYRVEFVKSGVTVDCPADQTVLEAAYAAGLKPPASCTQGMCGTCKQTMLSGEVDMQHNGGIRPREIAQNKVLICCSKPRSDLRIDV